MFALRLDSINPWFALEKDSIISWLSVESILWVFLVASRATRLWVESGDGILLSSSSACAWPNKLWRKSLIDCSVWTQEMLAHLKIVKEDIWRKCVPSPPLPPFSWGDPWAKPRCKPRPGVTVGPSHQMHFATHWSFLLPASVQSPGVTQSGFVPLGNWKYHRSTKTPFTKIPGA